jgi:uncharacterized DUF497 family protein
MSTTCYETRLPLTSPLPFGRRLSNDSLSVREDVTEGEKREIIIGHSQNNRLLLISFTEPSNAIRIISARLATRREREDYEQNAF